MASLDTWSAYYRRAAADEAALGNDKAARTHLRYARIAAAREALLPVVGTQDADRHLAGGVRAPGLFSKPVQKLNHIGADASFRECNHV